MDTQEIYRDTVQVCSNGVRKAKAHLELNLARDVQGNKKGFSRCISSKKKDRENVGLLLNGRRELVTKDMEKAETLSVFSTSVLIGKSCLQKSQAPETRRKV